MTTEDKKRFLELYDTLVTDLMLLPNQIADMKRSMLPNGVRYSDMPKNPSQNDVMAEFAARLDYLEHRMKDAFNGVCAIRTAIDSINKPNERRIITARYIDCETWYAISAFEKMSERGAQIACNRGIKKIRITDYALARRLLKRYYGDRRAEKPENE